jgi:hypothetical protein
MQDVTVARLQSIRVPTPLSPSFKCNVLRESFSVDSQNIPCATLKKRGPWIISVYLCLIPIAGLFTEIKKEKDQEVDLFSLVNQSFCYCFYSVLWILIDFNADSDSAF